MVEAPPSPPPLNKDELIQMAGVFQQAFGLDDMPATVLTLMVAFSTTDLLMDKEEGWINNVLTLLGLVVKSEKLLPALVDLEQKKLVDLRREGDVIVAGRTNIGTISTHLVKEYPHAVTDDFLQATWDHLDGKGNA
jgi:hypothetical protein